MSITALLGEEWAAFAARLDARDALLRWAGQEPALRDIARAADLRVALRPGADPAARDAILGALLRLAAADGGDDQDAAMAVLHGVAPSAERLRRRFDADLILGQLAIQVRAFPWRTRTRAYLANVLRDTEAALLRETRPAWSRTRHRDLRGISSSFEEDLLVDQTSRDETTGSNVLDRPQPAPDSEDLDLVDLLLWAQRTGVVAAADLVMLVEYHYGRELTGAGHAFVAARHGVHELTSKRRCAAALRALQDAAGRYLVA